MDDIQGFIEKYNNMNVTVTDGVKYSLRDVINKNHILYNGMFQTGEYEDNGFKRIFMRKMWVVYRTLIQNSDIDLKNLNIRSLNGIKIRLTSLLKMLFTSHLERENFGEIVDDILAQMCWHGTSIVKRYDGTVGVVDLRNYITEPNQPDPQKRSHAFIVEYTYDQMLSRKDDWANAWEEIEELWKKMQKEGKEIFNVIEFWTFNTNGEKVCIKYLDNTIREPTDSISASEWTPYIKLNEFRTPYKVRRQSRRLRRELGEWERRFPIEQFDLFKVQGRTLGLGCAELLGGPQEYYNELFTHKRKLDLKALTGIIVHNAIQGEDGLTEVAQEFISNLTVGGVITLAPGEKLQQLPVNTFSGEFNLMEEKIYELMRQIIGVTAQGTGEEVPASTSATQASINQQVANTVYDYVRERMHHGLKRLFNKGYAQDIIEEMSEEEVVAITGDTKSLKELDVKLVENAVNKWALDYEKKTGMYPTEEEYNAVFQEINTSLDEMGDTRFSEFKEDLLKNMEFLLTFEFKQEAFNSKLRSDALLAILQDPNTTMDRKKVEEELLSLQGLNPKNYEKSPEEVSKEQNLAQLMQQQ